METAAADFQLEKEILERKQQDHDEALKMKEQEKNQTIETLTSDRNALQRKVESIRKDLLSYLHSLSSVSYSDKIFSEMFSTRAKIFMNRPKLLITFLRLFFGFLQKLCDSR